MIAMQRTRGEGPKDKQPSADDATRILPTSDPNYGETQLMPGGAAIGSADRRGAIIGSAGAAEGSPTGSSGTPGARASMPGETVYIPSDLNAPNPRSFDPVVGWVVVRKGPGRGRSCPVFYGQNSIGRGVDQRISLDFGDQRISRQGHAFLIYDDLAQKFYIRDGGKSNIVRHNGQLVMTPTELHDRDEVSIGGTTLLFVALCGPEFDWLTTEAQKGADETGKAVVDESDQ
jgi:hypothetical protein